MNVTDLFFTLQNLPRIDKLKVIQFLASELAKEETPSLEQSVTYEIWSPLNSHEAAHKLAQLLQEDKQTNNG